MPVAGHNPGKWLVSPLVAEVAKLKPEQPTQVHIKDETIREGEETPKVVFTNRDRIEIALRLDEMGVEEIELPRAIPKEELKELTDAMQREGVRCVRSHLVGAAVLSGAKWKDEIKRLVDEGAGRLTLTNRFPNPEGLQQLSDAPVTVEDGVDQIREKVGYAKTQGVPITFGAACATQRPLEVLKRYYGAAVEAGADRVMVADSFGVGTPLVVRYLVSEVKKVIGQGQIAFHGHNDLGLATANTMAAVEGGAEWVEAVVNGLGDRAGNCPLEEIVVGLEIACGVKTGIKMEKLYELSRWFQEKTGVKLQPNKAIVGENAFLEEAASHYLGVRQAQADGTLEKAIGFAPELVGQSYHLLVGSTTLYGPNFNRLLDFWGFKYTDEQADQIRELGTKQIRAKTYVEEDELRRICESVLGKP